MSVNILQVWIAFPSILDCFRHIWMLKKFHERKPNFQVFKGPRLQTFETESETLKNNVSRLYSSDSNFYKLLMLLRFLYLKASRLQNFRRLRLSFYNYHHKMDSSK